MRLALLSPKIGIDLYLFSIFFYEGFQSGFLRFHFLIVITPYHLISSRVFIQLEVFKLAKFLSHHFLFFGIFLLIIKFTFYEFLG
jgi:hypothetical protein